MVNIKNELVGEVIKFIEKIKKTNLLTSKLKNYDWINFGGLIFKYILQKLRKNINI